MANDALARQAFDLVNQVRQQNGLAALQWNDGLKAASDVRAAEAGAKFSHTRPNGQDCGTSSIRAFVLRRRTSAIIITMPISSSTPDEFSGAYKEHP